MNALVHAVGHELPYQRMMVNSINSFYVNNPLLVGEVVTYVICDDPTLDLTYLNSNVKVVRVDKPSYNYFKFGIGLERMVNYVFYKWEIFANPMFRKIDNLLYMDVDTEVAGDVSELFSGKYNPGIYMADEDKNWLLEQGEEFSNSVRYCNAGVMFMTPKKLNQKDDMFVSLFNDLVGTAGKHKFMFADQCAINHVLGREEKYREIWKVLPPEYNFFHRTACPRIPTSDLAKIIHHVGANKDYELKYIKE